MRPPDQAIPCPITRAQAEIHPHLKERKKGRPGEDYDLIKRGSKKRGNDERSEESRNLSSKDKQKRREEAKSTAAKSASPVLDAGKGRGRGSPAGNKK